MTKLTSRPEWQLLKQHYNILHDALMRDLFDSDTKRFDRFSLSCSDIFLDYSKNQINEHSIDLLCQLAKACGLSQSIKDLFSGKQVNQTEKRPALHTALRDNELKSLTIDGEDIIPLIRAEQQKMYALAKELQTNHLYGHSKQAITDIINIGIGGSHLGPKMVTNALEEFSVTNCRMHFLANVDASHTRILLNDLNPDTTMCIVSSKSFTTIETLQNAKSLKLWLGEARFTKQCYAVTANPERAQQFGILSQNIFKIWDFIGGRFSLWSACGLPIVLKIGPANFQKLLAGAAAMDNHFKTAEFSKNMPIILGLLGIWYNDFFNASTKAILPYSHHLRFLPSHLQQLEMESCGKFTTQHGESVDYNTGAIIWGEAGTIGQHSFHQLLHQGTYSMPVDFIIPIDKVNNYERHQDILYASCLSQSLALMQGQNLEEVQLLQPNDKSRASHKVIPGNKPSNTILMNGLSPFSLGSLIALYEHKVFVQSCIWDINAFDQFGVELGKNITLDLMQELHSLKPNMSYDSSTRGLIAKIQDYLGKTTD